MRIAYLDTTSNPYEAGASGLRDIAWEMAAAAAALGVEAYLTVPTAVKVSIPKKVQPITFSPVPFCRVNVVGHLLTSLRTAYELTKTGRKFDYYHVPEYATTGVLGPIVDTPMISTVSGNIDDRVQNGNPFGPVSTQALKLYTKSTVKHSATIIAISTAMEYWWLGSGTPPDKLRQIPIGVDIDEFSPRNVDPAHVGFDRAKFNLVFAGRLSREKGLIDLLDAIRMLRHEEICLHLFGSGPLHNEISEYIRMHDLHGMIKLCGRVQRKDLPYIYSCGDLTVLPSYTEGLPRVMMESMACGCAFLGTEISGIEDHIVDYDIGFIVPPHSPKQLAERIVSAATDRGSLARIAKRGREYVCSTLSWNSVMQRVISEVYERGNSSE